MHSFQRTLLRSEIAASSKTIKSPEDNLAQARLSISTCLSEVMLASLSVHIRHNGKIEWEKITAIHDQKLENLSREQEKPVRTKSRILTVQEGLDIPKHILEFLSYGPKHPFMTKFDANLFHAQIENVVSRLLEEDKESSWVNDVKALALQYARKCKKNRSHREFC